MWCLGRRSVFSSFGAGYKKQQWHHERLIPSPRPLHLTHTYTHTCACVCARTHTLPVSLSVVRPPPVFHLPGPVRLPTLRLRPPRSSHPSVLLPIHCSVCLSPLVCILTPECRPGCPWSPTLTHKSLLSLKDPLRRVGGPVLQRFRTQKILGSPTQIPIRKTSTFPEIPDCSGSGTMSSL